jgi:glutathione S-transferase
MKLYDCAKTPNPRRARIFLAEKGIEVPKVEVNIMAGENLQPAYLAVNPRGLLPVLELDDGTRFDEVMAICRYFEDTVPTPPLLGRDPRERALVECLQRKMEFDGMIACSEVFRNQHPDFANRGIPGAGREPIPAIPALVERGRQTLRRFFANLEDYLSRNPYIVGDTFTMADITALCAVDFAGWIETKTPPGNQRTLDWYARVSARPSAKA